MDPATSRDRGHDGFLAHNCTQVTFHRPLKVKLQVGAGVDGLTGGGANGLNNKFGLLDLYCKGFTR